jgi:ubiquinone/menaquinone biosynthesis C-methylase UbiE
MRLMRSERQSDEGAGDVWTRRVIVVDGAQRRSRIAPIMASTDARFAGSVPAVYDRYLVPLLFEPYAEDLAARLRDLREGTLIELAAGTGAVTRALRRALPPAVKIVATDLNEGMLAIGSSRVKEPSVVWQLANAQELPFDDATADAVVCQFGVMFFPDKPAAHREVKRVLRPGGRYLFNVWDRLDRNEISEIANRAVAALFPEDPPRFYERAPFGHHDASVIRRELESEGFQKVEIETVEKVSWVASAEEAAKGLCEGTPLRGEIEARNPARLEEATAAATKALIAHFHASSFENRMSAIVVSAYRS